jgi:hypothetical protein
LVIFDHPYNADSARLIVGPDGPDDERRVSISAPWKATGALRAEMKPTRNEARPSIALSHPQGADACPYARKPSKAYELIGQLLVHAITQKAMLAIATRSHCPARHGSVAGRAPGAIE